MSFTIAVGAGYHHECDYDRKPLTENTRLRGRLTRFLFDWSHAQV